MSRALEVDAADMRAGDTYTDRSGTHWIVRQVGKVDDDGLVSVLLAAGRSQASFPEAFRADERVRVYR